MTRPPLSVIFGGGGTGGHLFPALAIAQALVRARADVRCVFLCSTRNIDTKILAGESLAGQPLEFHPIPAQPVGLHPKRLFRFLRGWGPSVAASERIIREHQANGSRVVIAAMGGFVAAPVVQAARRTGCPTMMVNLDAVPGKANRWIAGRVDQVVTALPVAGRASWACVGPIVREGAMAPGDASVCRARFGLDPALPTLLVTGGSQGAQTINHLVLQAARRGDMAGWQVIHQTGADGVEAVRAGYAQAGVPAVVEAFIREMGAAWGAASLGVCRAGAGSVAEAWANRVPTLFLPYPFHRDGHQAANAKVLATMGGCVVVKDWIHPSENERHVAPILGRLLHEAGERNAMREALAKAASGPSGATGAAQAAETLNQHAGFTTNPGLSTGGI